MISLYYEHSSERDLRYGISSGASNTGILNFKDQCNAHINMLIKKNRRVELEHNTPLIYCIPLSEANLEIKNHLATDQVLKNTETDKKIK